MGRSVSSPCGAVRVCYRDILHIGMVAVIDEDDNETEETEYDELIGQMDMEELVSDIREKAKKFWPSLDECEKWLDNEDRAILSNTHCYIGISTYCGLMSIWLLPEDNNDHPELSQGWCERISDKFAATFGELVKLGHMSNGEGVYQVIEKKE